MKNPQGSPPHPQPGGSGTQSYGTGGYPNSDEYTSLRNPSKPQSSPYLKRMISILIVVSVCLAALNVTQYAYYTATVDRPEVRDRIRKEWALEDAQRKEKMAQDDAHRKQQIEQDEIQRRDRIAREDKQRQSDMDREAAQRQEQILADERRRKAAIEREEAARRDRIRRDDAERERVFRYRSDILNRRQEHIDEVERKMKEDEERRKRANLAWTGLTMEVRCLEYNTRKYHAQLLNIPMGVNAEAWCMATPIDINGVTHEKPDYCEVNHSQHGTQVVAHWTVRSNEPSCATHWVNLQEKGCGLPGSNRRVYEAHLWNHQQPWDNWREMCATTPMDFGGHSYDHPDMCEHRGRNGIWGTWYAFDANC